MNISHGNRDKRCLPTENGGWNQQEKKPFVIISVRKLFTLIWQNVVRKNSQSNIFQFYLQIDWLLFADRTGFINRWERMDFLKWNDLLNRHNLNFRHLSKSAVLIGGDNIFKYWKTLPKQTQAHNPAFFISIQSTDYSFRHNFFPLCKPATVLDLVYISMKILSYSLNLLLFSEYIQGCYVQSMLLILRGGF